VHVWPTSSNDVCTHNIFWGYAPISPDAYGKELDYNLFHDASGLSAAHGYGVDMNSTSGDPGFLDPTNGDFRLPTTSAALALGITSLPADTYGVTSLSLRAQAATPPFGAMGLGAVGTDAGSRDCTTQATWRGATVENLCGLNEQTVVGLGSDIGVFVPTVPAGTQAAADGFQALDVILQFGGQNVASMDDLNRFYGATTPGQKVIVGIHRSQMDTTLTMTR
jgi:hypothetical protein